MCGAAPRTNRHGPTAHKEPLEGSFVSCSPSASTIFPGSRPSHKKLQIICHRWKPPLISTSTYCLRKGSRVLGSCWYRDPPVNPTTFNLTCFGRSNSGPHFLRGVDDVQQMITRRHVGKSRQRCGRHHLVLVVIHGDGSIGHLLLLNKWAGYFKR